MSIISRLTARIRKDTAKSGENQEREVKNTMTNSSENLMSVDDAVMLLDEMEGQANTEEMLRKAKQRISSDVKRQTISKCIISGREQGVLDYDKAIEPTEVWTAERERQLS
jgi:hypothetical protein